VASKRDPRGRDVRAADLQEKPTKRVRLRRSFRDSRFVGFDEDGGSPANIAVSGASHWTPSVSEWSNSNWIARRRAEEERADTLFVGVGRRCWRLPGAIRAERASASGAIQMGRLRQAESKIATAAAATSPVPKIRSPN
jgi:hypothetical protein